MIDIILFMHIAGIIIALGAVTVIDVLGFRSRKSINLTQVTIQAHHTTKPLIWLGTILVTLSWIMMLTNTIIEGIILLKTVLLAILIANGSFLSFYISPRLDKLIGKKVLLPASLQNKIKVSMILSFISWWSFVGITVLTI